MKSNKLSQDQSGLVAIIVTLIIMFVLSITVISFAITAQRNSRQALDRQLSTQAYYAAESGINDALKVIKTKIAAGDPIPPKTGCPIDVNYNLTSNVIDAASGVGYTCLLVNPNPIQLVYNNIPISESKVIPIKTAASVAYVELSWNDPSYSGAITGCSGLASPPSFPASGSWNCNASGVLRVDVVDAGSGAGSFDRSSTNVKSFFVYPVIGGPDTVNVSAGGITSGEVVPAACSSPKPACHLKLQGISSSSQYYLRIRPIYSPLDLKITSISTSGAHLPLSGAQATIDSTGKAKDVLRRVQVFMPLFTSTGSPDNAVQSSHSICKISSLTNNQIELEPSLKFGNAVEDAVCDPSQP